jgi:hypothetical protein
MAISRKQEERLLTEEEWHLVQQSHHPAVQQLNDADLINLLKKVRDRRNRAKTEAHRQTRELRGKAAAKGAEPVRKDVGTRGKLEILAMSMRRLNGEHARRQKMQGKVQLMENMRAALALKQGAETERDESYNSRHAHAGMRAIESKRYKSLVRPAERGRLRSAAAAAQAKRDSRSAAR